MRISILIVDDDKLLVEKLEETVNWSGIGIDMVFTANNIRQAQKLLEEYPIEMLLCDIDMPQGNGLELLEWIRYKKLDIECTFLSSYANFAYAQMALKLSSREYLLKPISNVDLETALRRIVGIVQEKHQKQKKQEKKGENEKQFWEDLLVQCLQEEYWIERAKKSGYCTPDETFRLILLRVLEIPDKEHYKKEISLYNFVITNVLTEYVETTEMKLETVVHVSDLEWAVVLRNHGSAMGTQEELAELRTGYRNTIAYVIMGTLVTLVVNVPASYALSRKHLYGRRFFTAFYLIPMFFTGGLIPTYLAVQRFHLLDTFWVMVVPFSVVTYYIIVGRTFFNNSIPEDLWEAAQLDGCGYLGFFFKIVLPLSKAVIAVIALWAAVGQWNSYFNALIYIRSESLQPLQIVLRSILVGNQTMSAMSTGAAAVEAKQMADLIKYAIIVVSSAPIMCMYPLVQKYFNQGVMLGSLKG